MATDYRALSVNGACAYISFGREYARVTEKEINQIKFCLIDFEVYLVSVRSCEA